jgi:hypothetical protein
VSSRVQGSKYCQNPVSVGSAPWLETRKPLEELLWKGFVELTVHSERPEKSAAHIEWAETALLAWLCGWLAPVAVRVYVVAHLALSHSLLALSSWTV